MGTNKSKEELNEHKKISLRKIDKYIDSLICSTNLNHYGKADKLSYWIEDWANYLAFEDRFSPKSLRRYKRGEIIKVHLGFNVGSEEGGLHYAVVLDKDNAKSSSVITVVPLTSLKPNVDTAKLHKGNVFLGNELFTNLSSKISSTKKYLSKEIENLNIQLKDNKELLNLEESEKKLVVLDKEIHLLKRMENEIRKMKKGSIALVNQIRTISKIRIYDPKTDHDILSNIKLSNEKLDMIDEEIRKNYTNL